MASPQFREAQDEVRTLVRMSKEVSRDFDKALRGYVVAMLTDMVRANPDIERVEITPIKRGGQYQIRLDALGKTGSIDAPTLARHADYMTKAAAAIYGHDNDEAWRKLDLTVRSRALPPDYAAGKGGFEADNKRWLAEVGALPSYRIGCAGGSLRVSLDYLPDCDKKSLWLDVDALDHAGRPADDRASSQCYALGAKSTPVQRRGFIRDFAELMAPLISADQGVRSWEGLVSMAAGDASLRGARAYAARVVAAAEERSAGGRHSKP
jgi:hypothetical protein